MLPTACRLEAADLPRTAQHRATGVPDGTGTHGKPGVSGASWPQSGQYVPAQVMDHLPYITPKAVLSVVVALQQRSTATAATAAGPSMPPESPLTAPADPSGRRAVPIVRNERPTDRRSGRRGAMPGSPTATDNDRDQQPTRRSENCRITSSTSDQAATTLTCALRPHRPQLVVRRCRAEGKSSTARRIAR